MRLIDADALKKRLQDRHDFWVNAWGGFSDMPLNDKSRVDELSSCIAEVVNAPTVELFCSYLSDGEVRQPCVEGPCEDERPQGEWIPVSERLPDKNMPCLVSVGKFNFTQIAMYSDLMETIDHKIFYQGDYGKNNFQNITEYVKAWQPLPEPYKKGGAE